jgi:hypothetical protein
MVNSIRVGKASLALLVWASWHVEVSRAQRHLSLCCSRDNKLKDDIPSSLFPILEAVPGRPEDLSNSKLVLLSVVCKGLMASDMSAARL